MSDISSRKADHIDLCIEGDVGFRRKSNLFEEVELVHEALPELSLEEIDLRCSFAGKQLRAPLVIAAMTGGVERANPPIWFTLRDRGPERDSRYWMPAPILPGQVRRVRFSVGRLAR